jgi:Copper transport outer membrane protein, MctB
VIDFRYHLVSIIAVFLALAVGLLVGATYLSGPAETLLERQQKNATTQNNTLRAKNAQLAGQVGADQAFAQAGAARLLTGLLAGEKVVVVEAPGVTNQMAGGVVAALQQSGATVTDQVLLQSGFLATTGAGESSLSDLARQLAGQAGVTLPSTALYPGTAGQQDAAAVIAAAIVSKDGVGLPAGTDQSILSGFAPNFLQVKSAAATSSATLAVLLTPAGIQPQPVSQGLAAFAAELKAASLGTVLAGAVSPVAATNAVTLAAGAGTVSTVDNADTESGQITVAQVLRNLLNGRPVAAYGAGPGSAPSPAPTPSASTSTTSSHPSGNPSGRSPSPGSSNGTGR